MTKEEVKELIENAISRFREGEKKSPEMLDDEMKNFIRQTIKEVIGESQKEESVTKSEVEKMVEKALEPLYKARGIATNLNNEPEPISKENDVFTGLFM